jgi:hypothetical protein
MRLVWSGAALLVACGNDRVSPPPASPPRAVALDATAPAEHDSTMVRLCTFRGHHGFPGITVALEASCGERSATCVIAAPPMNGAVTEVDVRVELTARSDATCSDRGTRVTSTCVLPATSTSATKGRYPTASSRLATRASVVVRVNGAQAGTMQTDGDGLPEPAEQCWMVGME